MKPPNIRFMTPMYHPNVDSVGRICVDILKDQWNVSFAYCLTRVKDRMKCDPVSVSFVPL